MILCKNAPLFSMKTATGITLGDASCCLMPVLLMIRKEKLLLPWFYAQRNAVCIV